MNEFCLYSEISVVNGFNRGVLIDERNNQLTFISKDFGKTLLKESFELLSETQLEQLSVNNFGFIINKNNNYFKKNKIDYDTYSIIETIQCEINGVNKNILTKLVELVEKLKVNDIGIHITKAITELDLMTILNFLTDSRIINLELFLPYNKWMTPKKLIELIKDYRFISYGLIYHSPFNKELEEVIELVANVEYKTLKPKLKEKQYSPPIFIISPKFIRLSKSFHNYYYRLMYIDSKGDFYKNINSNEKMGSIFDDKLIEIIESSSFQELWNAKKDSCDVCSSCEFRYLCLDERLPFRREDNRWFHKLECSYNPYICKWKGEEGYLTLKECGVVSDENGFYIDHEKIANINKKLWGE